MRQTKFWTSPNLCTEAGHRCHIINKCHIARLLWSWWLNGVSWAPEKNRIGHMSVLMISQGKSDHVFAAERKALKRESWEALGFMERRGYFGNRIFFSWWLDYHVYLTSIALLITVLFFLQGFRTNDWEENVFFLYILKFSPRFLFIKGLISVLYIGSPLLHWLI